MNKMVDIVAKKKALRTEMHRQRAAITSRVRRDNDNWICDELIALITKRNCQVVHTYLPMGSEIDIKPLIKKLLVSEITVVVPKTLVKRKLEHLVLESLDNLESGVYGTSHPKEGVVFTGNIDVIIVPGLAFDAEQYRLGYGGGYYDAFLAKHPNAYTVGICYPFQKVKTVPKESHDACLDSVLVK
jgi:5-formyltetrahydrofolate cyclo-ligase